MLGFYGMVVLLALFLDLDWFAIGLFCVAVYVVFCRYLLVVSVSLFVFVVL